jgi:peptidyl-prolyl cis-trans isomerase C
MSHLTLRGAALAAAMLAASVVPALAADDPVVAVVNGKDVHKTAVIELYQNSDFRQAPLDAVYPQVLDAVITSQLLLDQARASKVENDPQFKAALKQAEANLLRSAWLSKTVGAQITEDAVKARYAQLKPHDEVHARHILVKTEAEAAQVLADLKNGTKFEDEAKAKTIDPSGKNTGGDLGFFAKEEMVPEFANAAFAMKDGEVTQTPVKTQFGYHIIKVEEHRVAQPPAYDDVKMQILGELRQRAVQSTVADLRGKATVKKFNIDGSPYTEPKPQMPQQ